MYGFVRNKDNEVFGWVDGGKVFDYETKSKVLYDLKGPNLHCPTTGRLIGHLEDTEIANLKALTHQLSLERSQ